FIEINGGLYDKIIAFEPDRLNMINCQKIAGENSIKNIELIPAGLWDKEEVLYFSECGQIDSHLDSQNGVPTRMVALDQIIKQERVSFIKMDVEGAELKALHGARRTIIENKPLLAICVYHKPEDFVEIAEFIKSLVPEYKLYLRHYGSLTYETVLYAVL
ncbi:FkbM family methyltransferase, partial [Anaerotruncus colihominis]|uniref:FkbM family methyltransferase n=1 Tax=Anaerotruncus colihominis TaxID=169435 RepID=UPI00399371AE